MSQKDKYDSYINPFYSTLKPEKKNTSTEFSQALLFFLMQYPEFSRSKVHMEYLHYCLEHYINCDPEFRDLTIQDKLMRAGEMARDFMGIINNTKT